VVVGQKCGQNDCDSKLPKGCIRRCPRTPATLHIQLEHLNQWCVVAVLTASFTQVIPLSINPVAPWHFVLLLWLTHVLPLLPLPYLYPTETEITSSVHHFWLHVHYWGLHICWMILGRIWSSRSSSYEEFYPLGYNTVQSDGNLPTFQRNVLPALKWAWTELPAVMLVFCLAYSSAVKMEVICSSETSVDSQWTTLCRVPEHRSFHLWCYIRSTYTWKVSVILVTIWVLKILILAWDVHDCSQSLPK
jgi:hypothetical protein